MHCPGWVFDVAVSRCVAEFLSAELNLEVFASKYANGLAERYAPIDEAVFSDTANELMGFLAEIDAGEQAVSLITDYCYYRIHNEGVGKPRKLKSMFGSAEDPVKQAEAGSVAMIKGFRAYVFGLRSNTVPQAPAGWKVEDEEENLPHLVELAGRTVSLLDAF
ncbi:hypothetical protein [Candidatus Puniceispirillum marinum]|uniref:ApbE family lipoprotein n=1 Tax=Puniceispirillum marinum (strain IMCC1322) TaxID=488538 RepID=D5BS36_PUNMI|nr:hypothetical protein [Candidatus Puniceispirillum marinum]ADE39083.1 ApbE family lipoprotein [Candidatus Puniceispirillum marinum IMCC1322]